MIFSVTPMYAVPLAVIYLVLWMRVSSRRSVLGQSIGDGGDVELLLRIRQHGNCAEWSCFLLILTMLSEGMGVSSALLHAGGALLLLGRIAHPFGLKSDDAAHVLRYVGNGSNMLATVIFLVGMSMRWLGV